VAIARDDYDARRWRDAVADSREMMASSRSVVINAVDGSTTPAVGQPQQQTVAANIPNGGAPVTLVPVATNTAENKPPVTKPAVNNPPAQTTAKPSDTTVAVNKPVEQPAKKVEEKPEPQPERSTIVIGSSQPKDEDANKVKATSSSRPTGPIAIGSLLPYVEKQASPIYPPAARTMRATGVVKVEVTVDEEGNVEEVNDASGPALLQGSAKDAIRKWKFRPFIIDGQAVKATGFVNFNFSL
ncbi:MAG TPA: TonB family protein, partial [Pyrinomonadaceae bacterium]